jgi:transcriptional regulator with XRE-family HTH domain
MDIKNRQLLHMKGPNMWLENLKELKKASGMSTKQLADKANLPERTVSRIIVGETDHPRIDTLGQIVDALGVTMQDVFADTNVIVANENLIEIKEVAEVVEAERDLVLAELEMLRAKTTAQEAEIALLKERLQHKDELLALHNYYNKLKSND